MWGKFLANKRAMSWALSWPLTRETRTTHHWGPKLARVSRLSSSVQEAYLFLGFLRSLSSTSSLQLVPILLSLLSFLSRLLSLAVSSWVVVSFGDSSVAEMESGVSFVLSGRKRREWEWSWQGLHSRSPWAIVLQRRRKKAGPSSSSLSCRWWFDWTKKTTGSLWNSTGELRVWIRSRYGPPRLWVVQAHGPAHLLLQSLSWYLFFFF